MHSEPLLDTFEWLPMGGTGAAYHSCKGFQLTVIVFRCLIDITVHCEIVGGPCPPPFPLKKWGGGGGGGQVLPCSYPTDSFLLTVHLMFKQDKNNL